ncbi:protein of unknown function [Burkholderia multivorans]
MVAALRHLPNVSSTSSYGGLSPNVAFGLFFVRCKYPRVSARVAPRPGARCVPVSQSL